MPSQKHTTHVFHVAGMHCASCVVLTEGELNDLPHISSAQSSLAACTVTVTGDFGDKSREIIAEELTLVLEKHGYRLSVEKHTQNKNWSDFKIAVPVALAFATLFVVLQKMGIVNLVNAGTISYGTVFVVGIIASVSSCMAVVGGLVLSMSATFAREGDKVKPQVLFHAGRLASFFILGGIIGTAGAAFQLSAAASSILSVVIGVVMLILGINLLDTFHFAKKFQPSMPKFFSRHALGVSKFNHTLTPAFVGVATFFLPCGFTQSMQIFTLTTGSFLKGGLTMLAFALGTLPVLALVSFSSLGVRDRATSGVFFKTAGLIVIMFAAFNLINSLVVIGLIPPLFNF